MYCSLPGAQQPSRFLNNRQAAKFSGLLSHWWVTIPARRAVLQVTKEYSITQLWSHIFSPALGQSMLFVHKVCSRVNASMLVICSIHSTSLQGWTSVTAILHSLNTQIIYFAFWNIFPGGFIYYYCACYVLLSTGTNFY